MATRRKKTDVDAALKAVSESDLKKVVEQIGTTQAMMAGTMAALGVTFSDKIAELDALDIAIVARKAELNDIHDIEVQADTLDAIVETVNMAERQATERQTKRVREWDDAARERLATLNREAEEHVYDIKQRDERDAAQLHEQSTERQRQERFRMEDVNKRTAEKIEAVEVREEKMSALEAEVAGIPMLVEDAVTLQIATVTKQLSSGFGHEKAMLKKDSEAASALSYARQAALETQISNLEKQLEASEANLATAREDAKTIATAAVEASSQREVASSLKGAMETQASTPTGRGGR